MPRGARSIDFCRGDACRIDVWLWRARLFKTRAQSGALVASGRVHLDRGGAASRLDKPSKGVRVGDELVFAVGGRLTAVRIEGLGRRRGPPAEARALYRLLEEPACVGPSLAIDNRPLGLKNTPSRLPGAAPLPQRLLDDLHRH